MKENNLIKTKNRFSTHLSLKRLFYLIFAWLLLVSTPAVAGNLEKELPGVWIAVKIETTDQTINTLIQSKFKETLVEFTKTGNIKIDNVDTKIKYQVKKNTIKFSDGLASTIKNPVVNAIVKKNDLTVNIPADLSKQLILIAKEQYLKSGGETFVAKLIENVALNSKIEAVITLKRK